MSGHAVQERRAAQVQVPHHQRQQERGERGDDALNIAANAR
jgi:hypothetical protein